MQRAYLKTLTAHAEQVMPQRGGAPEAQQLWQDIKITARGEKTGIRSLFPEGGKDKEKCCFTLLQKNLNFKTNYQC